MTKLHSYPKVYNLGHYAILDLFKGPVLVEEKVDGSQFSFGIIDGEFQARSRGQQQDVNGGADKMFHAAIEAMRELPLTPGLIYRGELLTKPKHNTLVYDRVPEKNVVLYDIDRGIEDFLSYGEKVVEADHLGLEVVPILHEGVVSDFEQMKGFLAETSFLGGVFIEGMVFKAYGRFGIDGKTLMGKHVSEAFKEKHEKAWRGENPANRDVIQLLCEELRNEARWTKAIQHLEERGELQNAPQDIGPLMKEVSVDIREEEADYIKQRLFDWAWKTIGRRITTGLPEWYKDRLAKSAFTGEQ